jgi:catechol 2,3-dioxygenase-like lactoylglutathione lyase family enzyme
VSGAAHPRLGRIASATILAPDFDAALASYARALHLRPAWRGPLAPALAAHLDLPALAGARTAWLGPPDAPWLRVIDAPQAVPVVPMRRHGWLSLEVLVGDADAVAAALPADWTILGPPADLDVSPHIRACQAIGPCGEMYYLTEVKAPVPPFELPQTRALVDRPFIVVLSTPDRARTQFAWEALAGRPAWAFETKITVLNRELGRPLGERYPVAVIQFRERCLIEIDEVALPPTVGDAVAAGTWLVSIERDALDPALAGLGPIARFDGAGYDGVRAALWRGPCGERVELLERG